MHNNTLLSTLSCYDNSLTGLDTSNNISLVDFSCGNNQLTNLDVSKSTNLWSLYCNDNQLTVLDLSQNTSLSNMSFSNNSLIYLNLANGNNLNVDNFSATNNPDLSCIQVDDVNISIDRWTGSVDATANFSELCERPLSVNEFSLEELSFYPNPAQDILKVSLQEKVEKISVFTLQGENSGKTGVRRFIKQ